MSAIVNTAVINPLKVNARQEKCANIAKTFFVATLFFLPLATSINQLLLFLTVIFFLLSGNIKAKATLFAEHPLARVCVGFFLIFMIGGVYSEGASKDILETYAKMSKLLYVPVFLGLMQEEKWRRRAIIAFLLSMVVSLIAGFIKWKFSFSLLYIKHASPSTVFKNYIDTNLMMAFSVFILAQSLYLTLPQKLKYGIAGLMGVMTIYIFWFSEGRAGYVVFLVLWVLFCLQHFNFKKNLLAFLGLFLLFGMAIFFSNTFQARLQRISQDVALYQTGNAFTSLGQRFQFYENTLGLALERPIFGFGTGSYKKVYNEYAKQNNLHATNNPHNEYLNIFFQLGGMGLLYFMGLMGVIFWLSFKLPLFEKYLLQGALLTMMTGCCANSWLMDSTPGYLFSTMFGLCAAALPLSRPRKS